MPSSSFTYVHSIPPPSKMRSHHGARSITKHKLVCLPVCLYIIGIGRESALRQKCRRYFSAASMMMPSSDSGNEAVWRPSAAPATAAPANSQQLELVRISLLVQGRKTTCMDGIKFSFQEEKKMASWSFVKVRRKPRNISPCLWCHVDSKSREWIKQKEKEEREREKELFSIKMPACVMGSLRSIVCNIFLAMMVSAFFVWLELGLEMWIEAPKSLKERRRLRRPVRPSDRFLVWAQDVEICWRNYWNKQQHAVCFWNLSYPVEEAGWFSGKPHE